VLGVGALLFDFIMRPLRRLMTGTRAIGEGDLGYRIAAPGSDEFSDLAHEFDRMVGQLQETTVSKDLLQRSDENLRTTVTDLQDTIAEREKSERVQDRLRAELRRSETMAAMGALTAGVAHEVRNPLFGISSTLDAMGAQMGQEGQDNRCRKVLRREVDRLNKLMHDLLEYGKPPADKLVPGKLARVIGEAVRVCQPAAKALGVAIVNNAATEIRSIRLNEGRLQQVFVNLIQNALQHSGAGTEVRLDTTATSDEIGQSWIECTIKDSGPGFAPDELHRVFDPFYTRRRGGTGLGLSIVQRIVEEHKGRISVDNRLEGGAVVTVGLLVDEL